MKKLVFFDLDGTLLTGISSENAFFLHLLKNGYIGIKQFLCALRFIFKWFPKYKLHVFIKDKAYLTGLSTDDIHSLADAFVIKHLLKKIHPQLKERVIMHKNAGDISVLLTGSFDFLAKTFVRHLDLDQCEATECIDREHSFTNCPPKKHPFAAEKLTIAKRLCQLHDIPLEDCVAYGNSSNDIILLSQVGHPVAVNPDYTLRKVAKKRGWEIIE